MNELDLPLLLLDDPSPPIRPVCVHDGSLLCTCTYLYTYMIGKTVIGRRWRTAEGSVGVGFICWESGACARHIAFMSGPFVL